MCTVKFGIIIAPALEFYLPDRNGLVTALTKYTFMYELDSIVASELLINL